LEALPLVFLFGFFVLGFLTYRTYSGEPPLPAAVADPAGQALFTGDDISREQEVFLSNGLMW
jgi:nitric oxide reductase subunit B